MKYCVEIYGKEIEVEQLSNGKFKIPKEIERIDGWKSFQLKPAVECIVVAQKPRREKTIVGQVLKNGCGAVNVGACRIPHAEPLKETKRHERECDVFTKDNCGFKSENLTVASADVAGRFPANLVVEGEPLKGESRGIGHDPKIKTVGFGKFGGGSVEKLNEPDEYMADGNSPNRFYSLDAWAEKNNITLTEDSAFFDVPKPSKAEKNKGLEEFEEKDSKFFKTHGGSGNPSSTSKKYPDGSNRPETNKLKNTHPTTKPVKLFRYLAKLFCQPKGVILDPFMGSGTTGVACIQQGFGFVGIEKEKDYFEIAEARLDYWGKSEFERNRIDRKQEKLEKAKQLKNQTKINKFIKEKEKVV